MLLVLKEAAEFLSELLVAETGDCGLTLGPFVPAELFPYLIQISFNKEIQPTSYERIRYSVRIGSQTCLNRFNSALSFSLIENAKSAGFTDPVQPGTNAANGVCPFIAPGC